MLLGVLPLKAHYISWKLPLTIFLANVDEESRRAAIS